jgi:hypothetical protein
VGRVVLQGRLALPAQDVLVSPSLLELLEPLAHQGVGKDGVSGGYGPALRDERLAAAPNIGEVSEVGVRSPRPAPLPPVDPGPLSTSCHEVLHQVRPTGFEPVTSCSGGLFPALACTDPRGFARIPSPSAPTRKRLRRVGVLPTLLPRARIGKSARRHPFRGHTSWVFYRFTRFWIPLRRGRRTVAE